MLTERIAADRIQESRDRADLARRARQLRASHKDQADGRRPRLAALIRPAALCIRLRTLAS